jgi:hypothetical protein
MPKFARQRLHHLTPVNRGTSWLRRVVAGGVPELQVKPAAVCIALAIK